MGSKFKTAIMAAVVIVAGFYAAGCESLETYYADKVAAIQAEHPDMSQGEATAEAVTQDVKSVGEPLAKVADPATGGAASTLLYVIIGGLGLWRDYEARKAAKDRDDAYKTIREVDAKPDTPPVTEQVRTATARKVLEKAL